MAATATPLWSHLIGAGGTHCPVARIVGPPRPRGPVGVQEQIGKVGPETVGAVRLLERVGLRFLNQIDPFDAGPYYGARIDDVALVREFRRVRLVSDRNGDSAPRLALTLLSQFSVYAGIALLVIGALLLAGVGIYGVISYSVSRRTHEIGVRVALGASPASVLRLIAARGVALAAAGLILGLAGAVALTRAMDRLLFGVSATDVATFASIARMSSGRVCSHATTSFSASRYSCSLERRIGTVSRVLAGSWGRTCCLVRRT